MDNYKVSIITVSYNSSNTIKDTIQSVLEQTYSNIEYIIVDGASNDATVDIIKSFGNRISKFISEADCGMYDAMNKGIKLASGDIIGMLNADDFFSSHDIIETVAKSFKDKNLDVLYGDVQFVNPNNLNKIVRYYSSKRFIPNKFKFGIMPAHPSFYVKRELFDKFGFYKTDYKIGADFELLVRFLYKNKLKYQYLEKPFVTMRTGGVSNQSYKSRILLNQEIKRACLENSIKTNYFNIYSKYLRKIFEFFGNR